MQAYITGNPPRLFSIQSVKISQVLSPLHATEAYPQFTASMTLPQSDRRGCNIPQLVKPIAADVKHILWKRSHISSVFYVRCVLYVT